MDKEFADVEQLKRDFDNFLTQTKKNENAHRREPITFYNFVNLCCNIMEIPKDTFTKVFDAYIKEGKRKLRKPFHFKPTAIIDEQSLRVNSPKFRKTFMDFEFDGAQVSSFSYSLPMASKFHGLPVIENMKSKIEFGCLNNVERFTSNMRTACSVVSKENLLDLLYLNQKAFVSCGENLPKREDVELALKQNGAVIDHLGLKYIYLVDEENDKITLRIKKTSQDYNPKDPAFIETLSTIILTPFELYMNTQIQQPTPESIGYRSYVNAGVCPPFKVLNAVDRMTKNEYLILTGKNPETEEQVREVRRIKMNYDRRCKIADKVNKIYGTNYQPEESPEEKAERLAKEEQREQRLNEAGKTRRKPLFTEEELNKAQEQFAKMVKEVEAKKAKREAKLQEAEQKVETGEKAEEKNSEN